MRASGYFLDLSDSFMMNHESYTSTLDEFSVIFGSDAFLLSKLLACLPISKGVSLFQDIFIKSSLENFNTAFD